MTDATSRVRCGSYGPGHEVHWIQAKKVANEPGDIQPASVVWSHGDTVVIEVGGGLRRFHNHEAGRIDQIAQRYERRATFVPRWSVLCIPGCVTGPVFDLEGSRTTGDGDAYLFYLADDHRWRACPG